ncbi:hypothetical protein OIDMADRAFT_183828 [Oidiodendron maius Zn]|uniref:Homeobox domain-containing protein n=1 Tax=Oidiodendron maius (strain Zn) TaxID=913774 RepID=A0A0C3CZZ5_OIDMZ|nr:hypothetical protein OIDMADRAFT_183828 [Oidiodendron maius Zn]
MSVRTRDPLGSECFRVAMPLTALDLDPLQLTYEKLKLSVKSRADFRIPDVASHRLVLSKALASGTVWVGSTRVSRLDIQISFNDRPLDAEQRARILKRLRDCILNAKLWCQLSLSCSLEIPPFGHLNHSHADLSILLSQCSSPATSTPRSRGWISNNLEVQVSPSILSVQLEKLHIALNFYSLQEQCQPTSKRLSMSEEGLDSMLLDAPTDVAEAHIEVFEESVDEFARSLPSLMTNCLGLPETILPQLPKDLDQNPFHSSSSRNLHEVKNPETAHPLPRDAKNKLQAWLDRHLNNPYPTKKEKLWLMEESGLNLRQLERWFCKSRRRLMRAVNDDGRKDEMFLEPQSSALQLPEIPIAFIREGLPPPASNWFTPHLGQRRLWDQNNMSISFDKATPSLASEPSTQSSMLSLSTSSTHKRSLSSLTNDATFGELPLPCAHLLTSTALNILIGGSSCKRSLQNVTLSDTFPQTSLSNLAPSLFRPGFKMMMAHNSRFLPTVSSAISLSWVRNCQGPGLRRKLLELSNLSPPGPDYGYIAQYGEQGSVERLNAVVQSKVWGMMQRKLSDPAICGKIKWESVDPTSIVDTEDPFIDEDLLGSCDTEKGVGVDVIVSEEFIEDVYIDDDDLLLFDSFSDDEGLLSYFDEMEKIEVEKQTNEMLFSSGEYEDERDLEIELPLDGDIEDAILL